MNLYLVGLRVCCGSKFITLHTYTNRDDAEEKLNWLKTVWTSDIWHIAEYNYDTGGDRTNWS